LTLSPCYPFKVSLVNRVHEGNHLKCFANCRESWALKNDHCHLTGIDGVPASCGRGIMCVLLVRVFLPFVCPLIDMLNCSG
jgi:hypothetical protein